MGALVAGGLTGLLNQSSAQVIDGSLKFDKTSSTYLTRTPASAGNRKVWTLSYWIKLSGDGGHLFSASNDAFQLEYRNTGELLFANNGSTSGNTTSTALFRDPGAFYHIVIQHDAVNTISRFYINGTLNFTATLSNADGTWNNNTSHNINGRSTSIDSFSSFAMSQVYFIDGQSLGPDSFGFTDPLTGVWRPKKFTTGGTTVNNGTTWSSNFSGNGGTQPTNAFNGTGPKQNGYVHSGSELTVNFPAPGLSGRIVVYGGTGAGNHNSTTTDTFTLSDGSVLTSSEKYDVAPYWTAMDFGEKNNITSLVCSAGYTLYAVSVDGVILEDGVTNPTIAYGTNGFYLPMDGNSPIGEDQSGKGNNWTPVNFGGSVALDNPIVSGALPILNTDGGGNVARVGVRTDAYHANLVLALPLVGSANDVSNSVNSGSTTKTVSVSGDPAASSVQSNFYNGSFYFDGSASSDYVSAADNTELDVGSGDFTIECWAYVSGYPNTNPGLLSKRGGNGAAHWQLVLNRNGQIQFGDQATWSNYFGTSSGTTGDQIFKDNWHHIVITRTSGSVQAWLDGRKYGTAITNTTDFSTSANFSVGVGRENNYDPFQGYIQDVRVYKGVAKYTSNFVPSSTNPDILPDTPSGVSGSSKLAKVTDGAVSFDGSGDSLSFATNSDFGLSGSDDFTIELFTYATAYTNSTSYSEIIRQGTGNAGSDGIYFHVQSTGIVAFRMSGTSKTTTGKVNIGGWNHISVCRSSGTLYMSINGVVENFGSVTNSSTTGDFKIGENFEGGHYYKGQLSNVRFVKGTALYTSNFTPPTAPLTNVTNTKLLCCQSNTSAIAAAVTPGTITANGGAAATTFNPFNTDINTVRGQETGYPTWNPLTKSTSTLSNGNLTITTNGGSGYPIELVNTFTPAGRGQWYWEFTLSALSGSNYTLLGMIPSDSPYIQGNSNNFTNSGGEVKGFSVYVGHNGSVSAYSGAATAGSATATIGVGGVVGWAYDAENGTLKCSINGVPQGTQFTNIRTDVGWLFGVTDYDNSATASYTINFGQNPFKFPPPAGYQPLNAANLRPETVITRPDQFVGAITYSGVTNSGDKNITSESVQFTPDLVWVKVRTGGNESPFLYDTVRGDGSGNKRLRSDSNLAQTTYVGSNDLEGFVKGGFTMNGNNGHIYYNGYTHVAWCWRAGGRKNTFTVDNIGYASAADAGFATGGSNITPTAASVGTKQGFSIVTWDVGSLNGTLSLDTGLTQAPEFVITKVLDHNDDWLTFHKELSSTESLVINGTRAKTSNAAYAHTFNNDGTISGLVVPNWWIANKSYVFYSWHSVPGLQKFGSYNSNGNSDGNFVELGFKPAILWIKSAVHETSGTSWMIYTSDLYQNQYQNALMANKSAQEGVRGDGSSTGSMHQQAVDLLSNGFKLRNNGGETNEGGGSNIYIYCAWAEAPASNLYGGQSNAR